MNFKLEKLHELSGRKASVYTVRPQGEEDTLFDRFVHENLDKHQQDVLDIVKRIKIMGEQEGAKYGFFKHKEGTLGDLVCALYDVPESNLRLYCIRFGNAAIILGGGGPKSKDIKAWQEDPALEKEARTMMKISQMIYQRILDKDIKWSFDHKDLIGDLDFNEDD